MTSAAAAIDLARSEQLQEQYRRMLTIRKFEQRASRLYRDGEVPGFVHLSIGQEASAVGACWPLRDSDGVVSNHRGHGHCLAKGASLVGMFAELMGRVTGACGGLGGSMHIADIQRGIFGANGIVGAGLPIACGVGAGFRHHRSDAVAVVFFGDGAVAQGAFHEALNLASVWTLPVVFFCENNGYAEMSAFATQNPVSVQARGVAYAMETHKIDGNDVEAVAHLMTNVVSAVRNGGGPVLIESMTYRHHGHYEGDPQRYRSAEEREAWKQRDPLALAAARLRDLGVTEADRDAIEAEVDNAIDEAEAEARTAQHATIDDARRALFAPRRNIEEMPLLAGSDEYRQMDAVHDALQHAMEDDGTVWLLGIDVAEGGNVFGATRGLHEEFPDRVFDTPISETAIVGTAVGAAMAGTRPVAEIMYLDFIGVCFDQLINQAAKLRFMTGGRVPLPLVIRTQFGAGRSSGAQHSQGLEALLAHIPGLTVCMPSTPADAYGLLRAAIEDPNPVIVIEHRLLYGWRGARPQRDYRVPIGKGIIRRAGRDVSLVSWSRAVHLALEAAAVLAGEGIDVEVIDARTVAPLDLDLISSSVERTGRLVVAHEAVLSGGLGAEVAASIASRCFWHLDAPIGRVGSEYLPAPYSAAAEREWLLNAHDIIAAVREVALA